MSGPLTGVKVLELAALGPAPFACMMLADMGADVVRIDRVQSQASAARPPSDLLTRDRGPADLLARGRRSACVDLKHADGLATVRRLIESSDVLVEGWRPGVAERLGIGPDDCRARNERLVYARMTGWGQNGPYAANAGHDLNYIALAGALHHMGRVGQAPTPPLNLIADFGGGGMYLAFGITAALVERATSGRGQVVDAAMVDGVASLMTLWANYDLGPRGTNLLDTGAPFYEVYECADGEYVSIASVESQFYAQLRQVLDLDGPEWDDQGDSKHWAERKEDLAQIFRTRSRDEWCQRLEQNPDLCFAPVLSMPEAARHPHNIARGTFVEFAGVVQPAPAPRFSRTVPKLERAPSHAGSHTDEVLAERGFSVEEIHALRSAGVVG